MKNTMKKLLAILLCVAALLTAAAVVTSCNKEETKADEKMTVIVEGGVSSYKIVRPDRASESVVDLVKKLRGEIADKCGCEIDMITDWVKNEDEIDANAKEILIGNTNRPETAEVLETLEPNSWAVVNKGNKIVICANNDGLLVAAVDWFIANCVNSNDKTVKVEEKLVKIDGFGDDLLISVSGVSDYQIVYPKDNKVLEYYASLIQRETKQNGNGPAVVSDNNPAVENEIVVGTTARGGAASFSGNYEYSITTDGKKVFINASDEDTLYYAVNYYIEYGLSISDTTVISPSDYSHSGALSNFYSVKWDLNIPYMEEGVIAPAYNIGPGLVDDKNADTITDSHMHLVSNVEYSAFENYAKKLESFGFKKTHTSKTDNNELWGFRLGAAYVYIHYSPREKYIRVIWDKSSNCEVSDIEYVEEQTGTTTFYQYSIDLRSSSMVMGEADGWGMFYIVKLQDNSLVLVDGGQKPSWNDRSMKGLTDFMYDITGTDKKTPLNIRLWYFSHPDDDHNGLTQPWIDYLEAHGYKAPIIENVAFNYGSYRSNEGYHKSGTAYQMINYMNAKYPDVNYIKLHTGMVFNIGELKIETIGTIENMVGTNGAIPAGYDTNDTCALVRFIIGGKSFFLNGDTSNHADAQYLHLNLYSKSYFKSDVNQISHHGINLLYQLNQYIDAEYAIVPSCYELMPTNTHLYFKTLVDPSKLLYAGSFNAAFVVSNGTMTVEKIPRYDNPTGVLDPNIW